MEKIKAPSKGTDQALAGSASAKRLSSSKVYGTSKKLHRLIDWAYTPHFFSCQELHKKQTDFAGTSNERIPPKDNAPDPPSLANLPAQLQAGGEGAKGKARAKAKEPDVVSKK